MICLEQVDDRYLVRWNGESIGSARLYDNPCHKKNCYVELELERLDAEISTELFRKLQDISKRPLQVMVESDNTAMVSFLTAGSFVCRRKCYEVEAGAGDYIGGKGDVQLFYSHAGDVEYDRCCYMMFDYYAETHKAVSPWTADYETFCRSMPADVAFAKQDGEIAALAFVEGDEIAYACGADKQVFTEFARCLVAAMLESNETICFECDDCDWAAMQLKFMFKNQDETSFDTYVYDYETAIP